MTCERKTKGKELAINNIPGHSLLTELLKTFKCPQGHVYFYEYLELLEYLELPRSSFYIRIFRTALPLSIPWTSSDLQIHFESMFK